MLPEPDAAHRVIVAQARLFDTTRQAVIATTLDGRIVYWSEAADRLYGWSADEVVGLDVIEVTAAADSREDAGEIMSQLQLGRGWSGIFSVRHRSGERFLANVTDLPVKDEAGELLGVVGVSERLPTAGGSWLARFGWRSRKRADGTWNSAESTDP